MVVRANNVAYGEKACEYLGKQIPSGKVVQIMGDLASVNSGRLRGIPHLRAEELPEAEGPGDPGQVGVRHRGLSWTTC